MVGHPEGHKVWLKRLQRETQPVLVLVVESQVHGVVQVVIDTGAETVKVISKVRDILRIVEDPPAIHHLAIGVKLPDRVYISPADLIGAFIHCGTVARRRLVEIQFHTEVGLEIEGTVQVEAAKGLPRAGKWRMKAGAQRRDQVVRVAKGDAGTDLQVACA